ncbi:MAG: hypothetical protein JXA06_13385 [Bacteroidetes bacterium]|nr:hypothetical protein [Bacteroidota bacterium]
MHISESIFSYVIFWLIAFPLLLCLNSCVTFRTVHPEYLESDTTKDIVVYTFDGRIIKMMGGAYQIVRVDDTLYLRGQGQLFTNDKFAETKSFKDEILLKDIKNVETREKNSSTILVQFFSVLQQFLPFLLLLSMAVGVLAVSIFTADT